MSIWDPCPQSSAWGANCAEATLVSRTRKCLVTNKPVSNNKYFPTFVAATESKNCTNWKEMPPLKQLGRAEKKEALTNIPQYSNENTKFRFCIILAGPPGSGKSTMTNTLQERAKIINKKAANKPWIELGHDQIICSEPSFNAKLNKITNNLQAEVDLTAPSLEEIKENINELGNPWEKAVKEQSINYSNARGSESIREKENIRNNILKNIDGLKEIEFFPNDNEALKKSIGIWVTTQLARDAVPIFGIQTEDGIKINNTELLYIKTALCMINGYNITYETSLKNTGSLHFLFQVSELATEKCTNFNYIFLMGFPIVTFQTLQNRIINRYINWAKTGHTGFRKPCVTVGLSTLGKKSKFITNMQTTYLILTSLLWFCTGRDVGGADDPGRSLCPPGIGIDFLLIFDNTKDIENTKKAKQNIANKKEYIYIPISKRSYKIGVTKFAIRQNIKTNTKKALIALLMRNLNCLKGINCNGPEIGETSCKNSSCAQDCTSATLELSGHEEKSEESGSQTCWELPSQDSLIFDDDGDGDGGNLADFEKDIFKSFAEAEYAFSNNLIAISEPIFTLRNQLIKKVQDNREKVAEINVVFDNQRCSICI